MSAASVSRQPASIAHSRWAWWLVVLIALPAADVGLGVAISPDGNAAWYATIALAALLNIGVLAAWGAHVRASVVRVVAGIVVASAMPFVAGFALLMYYAATCGDQCFG